jgi:hypothetical protein
MIEPQAPQGDAENDANQGARPATAQSLAEESQPLTASSGSTKGSSRSKRPGLFRRLFLYEYHVEEIARLRAELAKSNEENRRLISDILVRAGAAPLPNDERRRPRLTPDAVKALQTALGRSDVMAQARQMIAARAEQAQSRLQRQVPLPRQGEPLPEDQE